MRSSTRVHQEEKEKTPPIYGENIEWYRKMVEARIDNICASQRFPPAIIEGLAIFAREVKMKRSKLSFAKPFEHTEIKRIISKVFGDFESHGKLIQDSFFTAEEWQQIFSHKTSEVLH